MKRLLPLVTLLVSLFILSACEDPSNVGLGLIGEDATEPTVEELTLTALEPVGEPDRTGNTDRVLTGIVEDPVLGRLEATGFINVARPDEEFDLTAPVDSVLFGFTVNYAYGDTTETVQLSLHDVTTEERWAGSGAPADTSLPFGEAIMQLEITPEDSLKRIRLPESWIEAHEDELLSDDFNDLFKGFALVPDGSDTIVRGFQRASTVLIVYTGGTPVTASGAEAVTRLVRTSPPDLPGDVILFQDSVTPDPDGPVPTASRLRVAFDASQFNNRSVNGARLELFFDRSPFDDTPEEFYRPEPTELRLVGVDEEGEVVFVGGSPLLSVVATFDNANNRLLFNQPDQGANDLVAYLQSELIGHEHFDEIAHLELRIPTNTNSIDTIPLKDLGSGETAPLLRLTLSGD